MCTYYAHRIIQVLVHAHKYTYIHIPMHEFMYRYMCKILIYACVFTYACRCTHTNTHACVHAQTLSNTQAFTHLCTLENICMHTPAHMHMHTQTDANIITNIHITSKHKNLYTFMNIFEVHAHEHIHIHPRANNHRCMLINKCTFILINTQKP